MIKANGICPLIPVPGNCAEAVATAPTVKMDKAKTVLRILARKLFLPLWVSDRRESPSGVFKGSQPAPVASPFNEELTKQFIVTQRISPSSRISNSATGIPIWFLFEGRPGNE
jgi:hypothetical protein